MVEEVEELELGDGLPKGKLWEPRRCVDVFEKGALAALI
jgi:hypothetical protein